MYNSNQEIYGADENSSGEKPALRIEAIKFSMKDEIDESIEDGVSVVFPDAQE